MKGEPIERDAQRSEDRDLGSGMGEMRLADARKAVVADSLPRWEAAWPRQSLVCDRDAAVSLNYHNVNVDLG